MLGPNAGTGTGAGLQIFNPALKPPLPTTNLQPFAPQQLAPPIQDGTVGDQREVQVLGDNNGPPDQGQPRVGNGGDGGGGGADVRGTATPRRSDRAGPGAAQHGGAQQVLLHL